MKNICTYLLFVLTIMGVTGCVNDLEKVRDPSPDEKKPTAITHNVHMLYSDSGKVVTEITAPLRYDYTGEKSYSEMPSGIKAVFYSNGKKSQTVLTAGYAMIKNKEDIMYVQKNVVIVNDIGEKLKTEELTWDNARKILYTYEFVEITKMDKVLYGEGIIANDNFSTYDILIPVGTLSVNE